jgi:hypothetical protein
MFAGQIKKLSHKAIQSLLSFKDSQNHYISDKCGNDPDDTDSFLHIPLSGV